MKIEDGAYMNISHERAAARFPKHNKERAHQRLQH